MRLYDFAKTTAEGGVKLLPVKYKGKAPIIADWTQKGSSDSEQVSKWFKDKQLNCGISTGKINNFWVIDIDKKNNGFESLNNLEKTVGPIVSESNYVVDTGGGGIHAYFQLRENETIPNLNSILEGIDIRSDGGQVISPFSTHETGNLYIPRIDHEDKTLYVDQLNYAPISLVDFIMNHKKGSMSPMSVGRHVTNDTYFSEGQRNDGLFRLACRLRKAPIASIEGFKAMIHAENLRVCNPPLSSIEVDQIATNVFNRYKPDETKEPEFDSSKYYGLIGKMINLIKDKTEASPEALYVQSLIILGNLIDRKFYLSISGSNIYTNEFGLIIGKTSKARKGTSFRACSYFFKKSWGDKFLSRLFRGISTGEGIIWALRDSISIEKIDKKGNLKIEVVDIGVKDKNALFLEEEFSKPIKNASRDTNNLSEVLRIAYDCETLQSLSKVQPARATDPNISVIGHTTKEEFIKTLNSIEKDNGMLNRILFVHSYRKNIISRPIGFDKIDGVNEIIRELLLLKDFISKSESTEIQLNKDAQNWWDKFYNQYAMMDDAENENIKGRTEVHILKLAMILAISDTKIEIETQHLESAKAIVDYSNQTIDYVFSHNKSSLKNSSVEKFIISKGGNCNRSTISHELFNRKKKAFEIDSIRDQLMKSGIIEIKNEKNSEIWTLATYRHGEISDIRFVDN